MTVVNRSPHPPTILWTGAILDLSGYGAASREYVRALDAVGVNLSVEARSFEDWKSRILENDVLDARLRFLMGRSQDCSTQVIHLTPDNLLAYRNNGKTRICYFAWETSLVPPPWVQAINETVVEAWVPCEYLVDACVRSGVTVPLAVIPHAIPVPALDWKPKTKLTLPEDRYKFYSIFQWSARKNPVGLIEAYYREFNGGEPVCLVLKTYKTNASLQEKQAVRDEITKLKASTKRSRTPPIILIDDLLGTDGVFAVHYHCDCYVTMTRSEGFGIPTFEAASMGKPLIIPNYSAFPEHFDEDTAYMIDVPGEIPVENMEHISSLYTDDMSWGDPSIENCRKRMREAFEHRQDAQARGEAARSYVEQNLNHTTIGNLMKRRLQLIGELSNCRSGRR
jgi:glycosyltransferase involved in cell wall biosynthesis